MLALAASAIGPARADMGGPQPHYNAAPPAFGAGGDTTVPANVELRYVYGSVSLTSTAVTAANITISICGGAALENFQSAPIASLGLTWGYAFTVTGGTCYRFNDNADPSGNNRISAYNYVDVLNESFESQAHANATWESQPHANATAATECPLTDCANNTYLNSTATGGGNVTYNFQNATEEQFVPVVLYPHGNLTVATFDENDTLTNAPTPQQAYPPGDQLGQDALCCGDEAVAALFQDASADGELPFAPASSLDEPRQWHAPRAGTIRSVIVDGHGPVQYDSSCLGNGVGCYRDFAPPGGGGYYPTLRVDVLKNGTVAASATWAGGEVAFKDLVTVPVSFVAGDVFEVRMSVDEAGACASPCSEMHAGLWAYTVGVQWGNGTAGVTYLNQTVFVNASGETFLPVLFGANNDNAGMGDNMTSGSPTLALTGAQLQIFGDNAIVPPFPLGNPISAAATVTGFPPEDDAFMMTRNGTFLTADVRAVGPYQDAGDGTATPSAENVSLRIELQKNGATVGSATWAAGEVATKTIALSGGAFVEGDNFRLVLTPSNTAPANATYFNLVEATYGILWAGNASGGGGGVVTSSFSFDFTSEFFAGISLAKAIIMLIAFAAFIWVSRMHWYEMAAWSWLIIVQQLFLGDTPFGPHATFIGLVVLWLVNLFLRIILAWRDDLRQGRASQEARPSRGRGG